MSSEAPRLLAHLPLCVPTHFMALFHTPNHPAGAGDDEQSPPIWSNTVSEPGTAETVPRMPQQPPVCRQFWGDQHSSAATGLGTAGACKDIWPCLMATSLQQSPLPWGGWGDTEHSASFEVRGVLWFFVVDRCCCVHLSQILLESLHLSWILLENFTLKILLNLEEPGDSMT